MVGSQCRHKRILGRELKPAEKHVVAIVGSKANYKKATIDYKFLAGTATGFILAIPICVIGLYYVYLKISSNIQSIVNEYGRG